jgi:hypothetical protein
MVETVSASISQDTEDIRSTSRVIGATIFAFVVVCLFCFIFVKKVADALYVAFRLVGHGVERCAFVVFVAWCLRIAGSLVIVGVAVAVLSK